MPVTLPQVPADLTDLTSYDDFTFHDLADKNAQDVALKRAVGKATFHQYTQRQQRLADLPHDPVANGAAQAAAAPERDGFVTLVVR